MNAERWQKVKVVLDGALDIAPPSSRRGYLDEACGGDDDLRREVESLLEQEDATLGKALEFAAIPAVIGPAAETSATEAVVAGKRIGNYKIAKKIGAGGMGTVYLAERGDGAFDQQVAVKIIKRGMDSDEVLRRFLNERQILASLEHPNIAHLIDGGTTDDGVPFFVMEYVDGVSIMDYAETEYLDIEARLHLFRKACAAVSYAHSNLVIHRDLKPSNILVNRDGSVKLLDFGIAKLMTGDEGSDTATQQFAFTPEYASPEQVRGEKLTTATDVYSLGVILYELLTGSRPYKTENGSVSAIIRAVCDTPPERPSAVGSSQRSPADKKITVENGHPSTSDGSLKTNPKSKIKNPKSLKGDLDNIILKSLRKEPERRYSSVEQFSEDIRRHLNGLPVTAIRDTWNYRTAKFVTRNRAAVVSGALIVLILIAGIVGTTWQSMRATQAQLVAEAERGKAERRFENLRKVSNSLVSEIERAIRDLPGSLPARQLLLERAVEQLDALAAESDNNSDLQLELIWAYQNLGALPDRKLSDRQATQLKAVALAEKVLASGAADQKARDRLAMIYLDLVIIAKLRGDLDGTVDYTRRAVSIVDALMAESPNEKKFQDSFWTANYHYALTMQQLGRAAEGIEAAKKILPAAEELSRASEGDMAGYDFMKPYLTHLSIGYGSNYVGDYETAVKEYRTALAICQAEAAKRPDSDLLRRDDSNIRLQLALALENSGAGPAALEQVGQAYETRKKMAERDPKNPDFQVALADAEVVLGQTLARLNRRSGIDSYFRRALAVYEKVIETDGERMQAKLNAARARSSLGETLAAQGDSAAGITLLGETIKFYESINADRSVDAHVRRQYAETLAWSGEALASAPTQHAAACESFTKSLVVWQGLKDNGLLRASEASRPATIQRRLSELGSV